MAPHNLNIFGTGGPSRMRRLSTSSSIMPRKPKAGSVFAAVRLGFYFGILVCTIICLAIAAHFESILESSDLTHFVPLAIFVSVASFLVILSLLATTVLKQRNPISTRLELASLGLLTILWLVLGSYLAASEAAEADVECFSADSSIDDPVELPGFTTDIFHAQYRVLEAFSIFNLILVSVFLFFLGFLALREHRKGYRKVWLYPVPLYPWFGKKASAALTAMPRTRSGRRGRSGDLPKPVTAKGGNKEKGLSTTVDVVDVSRRPSGRRPQADLEKGQAKPENRKSAFWVWVERPRRKYQEHQQQARARAQANASRRAPAQTTGTGARGATANAGADRGSWMRTRAPPVPSRPPMRQTSTSRQPLLQRQVTTREYTRNGEPSRTMAMAQAQNRAQEQNQRPNQTQPRAVPAAHTRDYRPERTTREVDRERERRRPELATRRTGSGPAPRR